MSERSSLRGSRLGATSYEDERGVDFAARQSVAYDCPDGHDFVMTFAAEADIPPQWECPRCGRQALRAAGEQPATKAAKAARTHWDMLLERRSTDDLEVLLTERLQLLREGRLSGGERFVDARRASRVKKSA